MITEAMLVLLGLFVRTVFGLFPPLPDPAPILGNVTGGVGQVFAQAAALAYWVPFPATGAALAVVAAVAAVAFAIKLVRIVASFLTLGGGSAA